MMNATTVKNRSALPLIVAFFAAVALPFAAASTALAASAGVLPVHGRITTLRDQRNFTLRFAPSADLPVSGETPVRRTSDQPQLRVGSEIDAIYAPATKSVADIFIDSDTAAGLPNVRIERQLDAGDMMPDLVFVDQNGRRGSLAEMRGKTVLLSFFYTRCPDREVCPAISGKFAYLQNKIDSSRTQLIELSVDPSGDSPRALQQYAKTFGADDSRWRLAVAEHHVTSDALALFGLSNLEGNPGRFLHDDVLAFIGPDGHILQLVTTVGWSPDDVLASVEHFNGFASNPIRRWQLAAVANLISACGGSVTASVAIMDSVIFVVGVLVLGGILTWFGRRIWAK